MGSNSFRKVRVGFYMGMNRFGWVGVGLAGFE
jgi:hypothetical protein